MLRNSRSDLTGRPTALPTRWFAAMLLAIAVPLAACSGSAPLSPTPKSDNTSLEVPPGSPTTAPSITQQPEHQTIGSGQTAQLTVRAAGSGPLTFQWYRGTSGQTSSPATGGIASDFVTPALTTTTLFWVRVSNAAGTTDSSTATVTVSGTPAPPVPPSAVAPTITSQPESLSVTSGQSAMLTVGAAGTGPLSFQWYMGVSGDASSPIPGATSSSFTTLPLTSTGSYWVRVSNSVGSANSATATVTVTAPPPPAPPSGSSAFEDEVLTLVNQWRAAGATCGGTPYPAVAPLALNVQLRQAARGHSQDMADNNYLSHTSLDGRTFDQRIWQAGFTGSFPLGENIAGGSPTPQSVVDGWMGSTGHCQNIMNGSFHAIGIGYGFSQSSTNRHYWTQTFGGG